MESKDPKKLKSQAFASLASLIPVLPVNNLDQSFSLQTRGLPSRVIASCKRGDPEKSLKFIIFIFCHLGFAGLSRS
jgi:hypothetical protein